MSLKDPPAEINLTKAFLVECLDCGHQTLFSPTQNDCPKCGSQWREARYDYAALAESLPEKLNRRPLNLWRYLELLPVRTFNPRLSLGEGGTPLIHAANLGMMLGNPNIYIKDERRGPTNSFKDRQAAVNIAVLKEAGITEAVLASTGNVAISFSAYAARAGIKLWAFLTSLVPSEKMREVALYGTQVVKVTASYDQTKQVAAEFARQRNLYYERGSRSVASLESMKTIAFEIAEQLPALLAANGNGHRVTQPPWQAPDWYIQSVSGGLGPLGVQKGFSELQQMGWIERTPAIGSIQTAGCAPMVHAFRQGRTEAEPIRSPRTHIATLSTGAPGRTYSLLYQRMNQGQGGIFEDATDEEAFRAMHILAKMEGISVEPATAVAFAGLFKLMRNGVIKPDEVVVVNCSGHTIPIETTVLGEGWARNLVIPKEGPEEGLLSALSRLSVDRFPRIAIVDDTSDARRLIRRILQSQGDYTLYEATNGQEAIELARRELPDLIILDLMMPELDGFDVLDSLRENPDTLSIPVIVVTAKELTPEEKRRLEGRIHALMQKGEFMNDELLDEVRTLVK
jgi:threonine synthase